jgi:hypothetical protein
MFYNKIITFEYSTTNMRISTFFGCIPKTKRQMSTISDAIKKNRIFDILIGKFGYII